MLIAYDTLFQALPDLGEQTVLRADSSYGGQIMLSMFTSDFTVVYRPGTASVNLTRHITNDQARLLGQALIDRADQLDEQAKQYMEHREGIVGYTAGTVDPAAFSLARTGR